MVVWSYSYVVLSKQKYPPAPPIAYPLIAEFLCWTFSNYWIGYFCNQIFFCIVSDATDRQNPFALNMTVTRSHTIYTLDYFFSHSVGK